MDPRGITAFTAPAASVRETCCDAASTVAVRPSSASGNVHRVGASAERRTRVSFSPDSVPDSSTSDDGRTCA